MTAVAVQVTSVRESREDYIKRLVDAAPPLSDETRALLRQLLQSARSTK